MTQIKTIKCEECGLEMQVTLGFKAKHLPFCSDWCASEYATRREEDKKDLTGVGRCGTNHH